ncbi:MAG: cysteine desulfurase NifS [Candidatus Handelsmanbacteria bacterium RIFCSPLOWO2_12_FULL_64_10]|uniref:cysteine desulfurase n=1 Tax=Handelsmanbacteria sp. (strain RIFCSPLOWO2_12_FULL_64_10) TaxID=1817868 RepID=A0A1F6D5H6_HANXR|nr:MAG: cysteine desulfurase NifS [Candidatus Handelsmanbacteria bacterium RIFCSPLOWO2_12_FULL_64_10]
MRTIYLDHNATTPTRPEVVEAMLPYLGPVYGNASSVHAFGREARVAVEEARQTVAGGIGADPAEVFFTSGGTEADNAALAGVVRACSDGGGHIITSAVEHHAVLHTARFLAERGCRLTVLPVDACGQVDPDDCRRAIADDTVLISLMHANNEIGTLQPVAEVGAIARERGVLLHVDAVQSFGKIDAQVDALGCDLLSLSAHKVYGPKGVGALYVRRRTPFAPLLHGGSHEAGRRAGTENVPGIVGFGKATELVLRERDDQAVLLSALTEALWSGLCARIDRVRRNGHPVMRTPNTLNVSIYAAEGESLILSLDLEGVAVSSGSACTSGTEEPSHVLMEIGLEPRLAQSSVRFSFGRDNTMEDVNYVLQVLPPVVQRLRDVSVLV